MYIFNFYHAFQLNPFCTDNVFIFVIHDKNLKCRKLVRIMLVFSAEFKEVVNYDAY